VQKEVLPVASDLEHRDEYPTDLVRSIGDFGLFGAVIPPEWGCLGLDTTTYVRLIENLAVVECRRPAS
jgi:alkylation response protein AidB-like acyl-CoA dehydrogenase